MAITPTQWSHVLTIPESYTPSSATSGQTLVITESVIAKLSSGDQATFWSNVQNGGGDVRICTDSGGVNQLPVEVVGLDSVAETCVIWTRKPTYNGTGDLYVFIGKAGETQPSVTDPFGRNAVWPDFSLIIHEGTVVDSTGNHAPVLNGSPSLNSGVFGLGYDLQLGNQYIKIPDSSDISFSGKSSYCVDVWSVIPALVAPAQMLVDKSYTSNDSEARLFKQNGGNSRHRNPSLSPPNLDTADTYGKVRDSFIFNGGARRTFSNDTQTGSGSVSGSISRSSDDLTIGSDRKDEATGGALPLKGVISDVWVQFDTVRSDEARTVEYNNQNDPATFFGTPTIAETGGATGVTADVAYAVNSPSVSAIASATAPATQADIAFSVSPPSVSASASATLPQPASDIAFTVNTPSVAANASSTIPDGKWLLSLDGTDDYVEANIDTLVQPFSATLDIYITDGANSASRFLSIANASGDYIGIGASSGEWKIYSHGVTPGSAGSIQFNERLTVELAVSSSSASVTVNGVEIYYVTPTETTFLNTLNRLIIGAAPDYTFNSQIDLYGVTISSGGATVNNYDPSLSGGAGLTLYDSVNSQNGTLNNFPNDNSQWVAYSDSVSTDVSFAVSAPSVAVSASATLPGYNATVSFAVNAPSVSANSSVTLPNPSADVSYTAPAPSVSALASVTLPNPVSDIAFSVSAPSVAVSAAATEPNFNANVAFTVNAPTVSISASATLPQPESAASFAVSPPTVSVVAIVGGIAIIVDEETNINQRALSNNINAPILSNNING